MNALQTLISETMAAKGLRKSQIVSLLGFKNITKGIRRLDAFVADGVDFPGMLDRLPSALGLPAETVHAAYEQTLDQMRAEAEAQRSAHLERLRAEFRPHVRVKTERTVPSPIFVVAMTGGPDRWLRISLPEEITALPEHEPDRAGGRDHPAASRRAQRMGGTIRVDHRLLLPVRVRESGRVFGHRTGGGTVFRGIPCGDLPDVRLGFRPQCSFRMPSGRTLAWAADLKSILPGTGSETAPA